MQTIVKVGKYLFILLLVFTSCSTSKPKYSRVVIEEGEYFGVGYVEDIEIISKDTSILNKTFKVLDFSTENAKSVRRFLENYIKKDSVENIKIFNVDSLYISDILCEYKYLTSLRINGCDLKEFKLDCELITLSDLDLSNNQLDETCFEFIVSSCPNVVRIDIGNNLVKSLPESLIKFEQLRNLGLSDNPITSLDFDILEKTKVLRYIHIINTSISEEECQRLNNEFNFGKLKEDKMRFFCKDL